MDKDKPDGCSNIVGVLIFGAGLLFGGFLVYLIMRKSQTLSANNETNINTSQSQTASQSIQSVPQSIQLVPQLVPHSVPTENVTIQEEKSYKNDEKWLIERGPDGRIKSLNVIRDAKVS